MSKICNAEGRKDGNSGYTRVLGDDALGVLCSKIQATVISSGTELEKLIIAASNEILNLDSFISDADARRIAPGSYVCGKAVYKKSKYTVKDASGKLIIPDLLIFIVKPSSECNVIELKDGDNYDTKKVIGERDHLIIFRNEFGRRIPFITEFFVCCFNQLDKDKIYEGFKKAIEKPNLMTGKELCNIIGIDYDAIVNARKADQSENLEYVYEEIFKIKSFQDFLTNKSKV